MKRRDFIKSSCSACLSATGIAALASGCAMLANTTGSIVENGLQLNSDDFKIKTGNSVAYKSFIVVRNDALKYPVCVYRFTEKEYSALWMECSHQGAELQASGDYLQCPAHGSEFNNKGKVTTGPAGNDLRVFPVTVTNNQIFIDLRKQS